MKKIAKIILFPFIFLIGYFVFLFTKRTNNLAYASFRFLFVASNGRTNDILSKVISVFHPYKKSNQKSQLLENTHLDVQQIVSTILENGYSEFELNLPVNLQEKLVEYALTNEAKVLDVAAKGVHYLTKKVVVDFNHIDAPRYQFEDNQLVKNQAVQEIIFDSLFVEIAGNYLKCQPILDIVTMWWSFPFNHKATSQAAQMYHFDMDRIKFIKFFFYLTDVHTDNGPHCYIGKSHHRLPKKARQDRRLSDDELSEIYSEESFKEFVGKKGTILAVDTRGLHKGKPLVKDSRLLFQIQFSNSLFGAPYEKMTVDNQAEIPPIKRTYQLLKS